MTNGEPHFGDRADPTILTQQALQREVDSLKELIELRLEALRDLTDRQFELVERQRVEQKEDSKEAINAALIAQKEAVREQTLAADRAITKSEAATNKRLDESMTDRAQIKENLVKAVTVEKFDAYTMTSNTAREVALQRVDERFEDHVKRYEYRQREVDQLIAASQGAADKVRELAAETARRSNRNIGMMGVGVSIVVVLMRLVGLL